MAKTLTPEQLEALRRFDVPTVANAIETFNVQPRNTGFMLPDIRCMFPDLGVMVGFACTAVIAADHQPSAGSLPERPDWWRTVLHTPTPRVVVLQDSDASPVGYVLGRGAGQYSQGLGLHRRGDKWWCARPRSGARPRGSLFS